MLAALVLFGVCSFPPLFDDTGPACSDVRQPVECGCSECFEWDAVLADPIGQTPAASWYELLRQNPDGTTVNVGSTQSRTREPYTDDDGNSIPELRPTVWCAPWDAIFPREGETYLYRVRACTPVSCGAWSSGSVTYTAAPYACYDETAGRELPCYLGDALTH